MGLFHFSAYGPTSGKPRQEPRGRNWNRDQRGVLLPGLFQAHIQLPLLDILVNLPNGSTASSEMGLPTSFSNQENTPTDLPTSQFDESSSSVEIPSLLRTNRQIEVSGLPNPAASQSQQNTQRLYLTPNEAQLIKTEPSLQSLRWGRESEFFSIPETEDIIRTIIWTTSPDSKLTTVSESFSSPYKSTKEPWAHILIL